MDKRNILIISYYYKPIINPRAFRWSAIAEYWANQGHRVFTLCAWAPELVEKECLNAVHVYRTGGKIIETIRGNLGVKKPLQQAQRNRERFNTFSVRSKATQFIKVVYDYTWKKIYWPDYACLWYFSAIRAADELYAKNQFDSIISVSVPFTSHLVGLHLKNKHPSVQWLVDIGDPFCFHNQPSANNQKIYKLLNYKYEGKIFKCADAVSVTTESTLKRYAQIFNNSASKIHVIPPLFLQQESNKNIDLFPYFSQDKKLRLVFIGTLLKAVRNPDYLLLLFNTLLKSNIGDRIELHFFGNIGDSIDLFNLYPDLLDSKIFLHGLVSQQIVDSAIKKADILVNIGNSTAYQLPSKLIEYVNSRKPILNIISISEDSSRAFLNKYPAAITLLKKTQPSKHDIEKIIGFLENPPILNEIAHAEWLSSFRLTEIVNSYEKLLIKS